MDGNDEVSLFLFSNGVRFSISLFSKTHLSLYVAATATVTKEA